jgi:hypothetical protein
MYRQASTAQGQVHQSGSAISTGYSHTVSAAVDSMRSLHVSQSSTVNGNRLGH